MPKFPSFSDIRKKVHYWLYEESVLDAKPLRQKHSFTFYFVMHMVVALLPMILASFVIQYFVYFFIVSTLAWIPYCAVLLLRRKYTRSQGTR